MTDPNLNAVLSSIRALLIAIGSALALHGLGNSGLYFWVQFLAGSVMIIGPAAWGVFSALSNYAKAKAVGVQAGINLTVSGNAVTDDGTVVSQFSAGATPPKQVTLATAEQIVKDFGPAPSTIAKS